MEEFAALVNELDPPVHDFSGVLGRALDALALPQIDLARGVGASPSAVCRWQSGESLPSAITQKAACRWLRRRVQRQLRILQNAAAIAERAAEETDLDPYPEIEGTGVPA